MMETLRDMTMTTKKRRIVKNMQTDIEPYLPQDLVVEKILTRLSLETLIKCGCVCKLWYKSIHHDPHFLSSHFRQSQKNPYLMLAVLNIAIDVDNSRYIRYLYNLLDDKKRFSDCATEQRVFLELISVLGITNKRELVGHCNGLFCFSYVMPGYVEILNPSRYEVLYIFSPLFDGSIICYGFGFDRLTKEYKVVLIFRTFEAEFKCLVFTLGSNSWRETTVPPPSPHQVLTPDPYSKSAIFCGGALFWRTRENMLLSFDLHDEMFQLIQLPAEISSTTTIDQQQKLVHLLEYKGSLCVGRLEITFVSGRDGDHQSSNSSRSYKVHLHSLKSKVKKIWIKETFDLDSSFSNISFLDNTTTTTTSIRIMSFSDRVLLYLLNGGNLELYNLHTKRFMLVAPEPDEYDILDMKGPSEDMYYQLNSFIENIQSLRSFVPEGARKIEIDALNDLLKKEQLTPLVLFSATQVPKEHYIFVN